MAIFPDEPGLASFIGAKDNGIDGDNWSYKSCKAPVKSSPSTNQHPAFYRPDDLPIAQPTVSKHWREKGLIESSAMSQIMTASSKKSPQTYHVLRSMLCSWGNGYCSIRACQFWHSSVIELRVIIMKTIIKLLAAECCRLVVRRNYTALLCVWFITHDSCCCGGWLVSQCTVAPVAGHWHCCCLLC